MYHHITDEEQEVIAHARRSLLFNNKEPWCKKDHNNLFDVTMGAYDGAEVCELVGSYLLSLLMYNLANWQTDLRICMYIRIHELVELHE